MKMEKKEQTQRFAAFAGGAAATWTVIAGGMALIPGGQPGAVIAGLGAASLGGIAWMASELGSDPPRLDFFDVNKYEPRSIGYLPTGDRVHDAFWVLTEKAANLNDAMRSLLSAVEREEGARLVLNGFAGTDHDRREAKEFVDAQDTAARDATRACADLLRSMLAAGDECNAAYETVLDRAAAPNAAFTRSHRGRWIPDFPTRGPVRDINDQLQETKEEIKGALVKYDFARFGIQDAPGNFRAFRYPARLALPRQALIAEWFDAAEILADAMDEMANK